MPKVTTRKRPRNPSVFPGKNKQTRLEEAYERLGVTSLDVETVPKITHILKELPAGQSKAKGTDRAIEFLRGSGDADARKWLDVYDLIPAYERKILPFEAFCVACNLTTKRVLELVTGACFEQSTAAAILIAKAAHPTLVKKSISLAKQPGGWEDRKMLHQREGFAPIPKTQVVNVQGDVNTDNRTQTNLQNISIGELAGIEDNMGRIADRFNESLGIGEGSHRKTHMIEGSVESSETTETTESVEECTQNP